MQMGTFKSYRRINNSPVSAHGAARYRHIVLSNLTRARYCIVYNINTVVKLKRAFRFDRRSILHGLAVFRVHFLSDTCTVYGKTFVNNSFGKVQIRKNEYNTRLSQHFTLSLSHLSWKSLTIVRAIFLVPALNMEHVCVYERTKSINSLKVVDSSKNAFP